MTLPTPQQEEVDKESPLLNNSTIMVIVVIGSLFLCLCTTGLSYSCRESRVGKIQISLKKEHAHSIHLSKIPNGKAQGRNRIFTRDEKRNSPQPGQIKTIPKRLELLKRDDNILTGHNLAIFCLYKC